MPSYTLDMIPQTYPKGCWIAATNMLRSYAQGYTITDDPSYEEGWLGPNGGLNTDADTLSKFAEANGMTFRNNPSLGAMQNMINRGPFMALGKFSFGAHFYVFGGMDSDQSLENTGFDLYDPMPVNVGKVAYSLSLNDFKNSYNKCCVAIFQMK